MDTRSIIAMAADGSQDGSLTFPEVLGLLAGAGVEGYHCDLRAGRITYYLPNGETIDVASDHAYAQVAAAFDAAAVANAVGQSQRNEHTYRQFCTKVTAAGCAGYIVSLPGRRVVYFGRTAETHVEHFPA